MRNRLGTVLVVVGLVVPAALNAQRARAAAAGPKHEFGVDLAFGYAKPSGIDGVFFFGTPVDVRMGFVSQGSMSFEGRLTMALLSGSGTTIYSFDPGVNVLFRLGQGTLQQNKYFTVGADIDVQDNGVNSGAVFGVNAGIGMRKPYGSAAWRFELFGDYDFENTNLGEPGTMSIGLRAGISLWH